MSSTRSALSREVTQGYWTEVSRVLQKQHGLSNTASHKAIAAYRQALADAGVGDITYHAPIGETADGIVIGGYIAPSKLTQTAPASASTRRDESKSLPKRSAKSTLKRSARKAIEAIK